MKTERELLENAQYFGWDYISMFNEMTEGFMKKYKTRLDWDDISSSQKFSEEFFMEFSDKITFSKIDTNINSWARPENLSKNIKSFLKIKGDI